MKTLNIPSSYRRHPNQRLLVNCMKQLTLWAERGMHKLKLLNLINALTNHELNWNEKWKQTFYSVRLHLNQFIICLKNCWTENLSLHFSDEVVDLLFDISFSCKAMIIGIFYILTGFYHQNASTGGCIVLTSKFELGSALLQVVWKGWVWL